MVGISAAGRFEEEPSGSHEERLLARGVPFAAYRQALASSYTERMMCPEGAAKTAPGFYAYNGMVAALTTGLRGHDWVRLDLAGSLPLFAHEELRIKFAVTSGTAMTGTTVPGHQPRTRYAKGELFQQMIRRNADSAAVPLFDLAIENARVDDLAGYELWLLLMYFDKAGSEIRSEFSRPVYINEKGVVASWSPRIVVPPYEVDNFGGDDPNEGFGEINVPVSPK